MRISRISQTVAVLSFTVAFSSIAQAQSSNSREDRQKPGAVKGSNSKQRASGVILNVEKIAVPHGRPAGYRLTINSDAVWRDWSRDQVRAKDTDSAKKDAAEGKNSVATRGEPVEKNNLAVVDILPETRVETRFRSPGDETSKGSKTPEAASADGRRNSSAKPVQFMAQDLKPGLFVEVDYRHNDNKNPATVITVIRPTENREAGSTERSK